MLRKIALTGVFGLLFSLLALFSLAPIPKAQAANTCLDDNGDLAGCIPSQLGGDYTCYSDIGNQYVQGSCDSEHRTCFNEKDVIIPCGQCMGGDDPNDTYPVTCKASTVGRPICYNRNTKVEDTETCSEINNEICFDQNEQQQSCASFTTPENNFGLNNGTGAGTGGTTGGAVGAPLINTKISPGQKLPQPGANEITNTSSSGSLATYLGNMFNSTTNIIMLIITILAVMYLIYSGYLYLTSAGNPEKTKLGRAGVINAVIGIVVIVATYGIINFAMNIGGATSELLNGKIF